MLQVIPLQKEVKIRLTVVEKKTEKELINKLILYHKVPNFKTYYLQTKN